MSAYRVEVLQNGKSYKPELVDGKYNNYWITKFLVMSNSASNIKLWTNIADVNDASAAIDIPASALVAGNEYEIAVGKISWSGDLKILAYQTAFMPVDYPIIKK